MMHKWTTFTPPMVWPQEIKPLFCYILELNQKNQTLVHIHGSTIDVLFIHWSNTPFELEITLRLVLGSCHFNYINTLYLKN